jgi:stage II sporulation protein AB (anti-sigma F factor)
MLSKQADNATLNLKIPASPSCGWLVRDRIAAFARQHELDPEDAREFVTAIGEALANAIEHSQSKSVEVSCWVDGNDKLVATVVDSGCGFSGVPDGPVLPPPHAERGRGLPIMQRYSDILKIDTEPGKGTTVLLGRKLRRVSHA